MDILDIFKTLAEEPDKIGKRGMAVAKLCVNLVFAGYLFKLILGPYILIDFSEINQWVEFVMSGRLIFSLIFYALSDLLLFRIGPDLLFHLLYSFYKLDKKPQKPSKMAGNFIRWILQRFKFIAVDKKKKAISPGHNIGGLLELAVLFSDTSEDSSLMKLRNSLANEIWELSVGFLVVYFWVLPFHRTHVILNWIFCIFICIIPGLYLSLCKISDLVNKDDKRILLILKQLTFQNDVLKALLEYGIKLYESDKKIDGRNKQFVKISGKEYLLEIHNALSPAESILIKMYCQDIIASGNPIIFTTNMPLTSEVKQLVLSSPENLTVAVMDQSNIKEILKETIGILNKR